MLEWLTKSENQALVTLLFTGLVAISSGVYATLTWWLVSETRKMRKVHTEPRLSIIFSSHDTEPGIGRLRIQNIGLGPAYDISFSISAEESSVAATELLGDFTTARFLEKGVNYLAPNQSLYSGVTSFYQDNGQAKLKVVLLIKLNYYSTTRDEYKEPFRIDFSQLLGTGNLGRPPLYLIADSIKNIEKSVGNIANNLKK